MNLLVKKYNILRYLFTAVLLVGLSCSSDNGDVDDIIIGDSSLSFIMDGKKWEADNVVIQTYAVDDHDNAGIFHVVNIAASIGIKEDSDDIIETFTLHFYISENNFKNPKGVYPIPPPEVDYSDQQIGFGMATFASLDTNNYYFTVDPEDANRVLGEATINSFKIGEQFILGEGYLNLSGTFQFKIFGVNRDTGKLTGSTEIKSGKFDVKALNVGFFGK